ncbi:DUF1877 family protein [Micromonospora sp. DT62]|uniref:DUF1877 family protein n=1 Tax=Micromonospora sp. DT62 TaxID=3416521 RepID=UPI003CECCAE2
MSVLGDFARLSPEQLEEFRTMPSVDAYSQLADFDEPGCRLDLDRTWSRLAFLIDAAHLPINPITVGSFFPDERTAWGQDGDSRSLTPEQVAQAAVHLMSTPFDVLAPHVRAALTAEYRGPLNRKQSRYVSDILPWITEHLAAHYRALVEFFDAAARNNQCTVFWAA